MPLTKQVKMWLHGLGAAAISSAANVTVVLIVDPAKFSPMAVGGWKNLGLVILVSSAFGAASYLKQSPLPSDSPEA